MVKLILCQISQAMYLAWKENCPEQITITHTVNAWTVVNERTGEKQINYCDNTYFTFVLGSEQNDGHQDHNNSSSSSNNNNNNNNNNKNNISKWCRVVVEIRWSIVGCFCGECCGGHFCTDGRVWFCKGQKNKAFYKTIDLTSLQSNWSPKHVKCQMLFATPWGKLT